MEHRGSEAANAVLSDLTVQMKYARYLPDLGRRETWDEIVTRNKEMHLRKYPELAGEIERHYRHVYARKVLPSMRSMQFGGKAMEVNNARGYNCSYVALNHPSAFAEIMFLLLSGCGVGYSVQRRHVSKLPTVKRPRNGRAKRFLVGDSIEGWADAVKVLLDAYFHGKQRLAFDFRAIRAAGSPLKTSGGIAPGPQPLKDALHNVQKVLEGVEPGAQLTPLQAHDVCCHLADSVLAGGVRRSAMIALFDVRDEPMLTCKSGDWFEANPQRGRANNTAVLARHKATRETFDRVWDLLKAGRAGEPGFMFTHDSDWGLNPCGEISLRDAQFCVSGDTPLLTRQGMTTIRDAAGKEIEIWNGEEWATVTPFQTGRARQLFRVRFSDGSYLDVTANHRFLAKRQGGRDYREVSTLELEAWLARSPRGVHVPRTEVRDAAGVDYADAYDVGMFLGDGHLEKGRTALCTYRADKAALLGAAWTPTWYSRNEYGTPVQAHVADLDVELCARLKSGPSLPAELFTWSRQSALEFLAGWLDADGSQAGRGVRLYGRRDLMRGAQLLLARHGYHASLNLMARAGQRTNLGVRKQDMWYLQITRNAGIPCRRLSCENGDAPKGKGRYQFVRSITVLPGRHDTYCVTEPKTHCCLFGTVLTKQCNLGTINAADLGPGMQDEFEQRAEAAAFICTLQAGYTDFHYLREQWHDTTEKEALIGVSMTGIAAGGVLKLDVAAAARCVLEMNGRIAKAIGIKPAGRCTTVKPEGTGSLVLSYETPCSSGVHAYHAPFYKRRFRVGKNEPIYAYLAALHPTLLEDDFFKPTTNAIITIPVKAPDGAVTRSESALELLERVQDLHERWVKPGHRKGANTNNVSTTITVKDDEWDAVADWMWQNRHSYTALSILPYDGHSYTQAPFEEISEAEYHVLVQSIGEVDMSLVREDGDYTTLLDQAACAGGACEIDYSRAA